MITRKSIQSVCEIGCGGGWFTEGFASKGLEVTAIEGSKIGYEKTRMRLDAKNLNNVNLIKHDLRKNLNLERKFDLVICTEVAEHIEPPFSALLVLNLISHGDLIWFSTEPPFTNDAHYHHSNEQPTKFWSNLFKFYDFSTFLLNHKLLATIANRGGYVITKNSLNMPEELFETGVLEKILENNLEEQSIGTCHNNDQIINKLVKDIELLQNINLQHQKTEKELLSQIEKLKAEQEN